KGHLSNCEGPAYAAQSAQQDSDRRLGGSRLMRVLIVHNAVLPGAAADDRDVLVQRDAVMAALSSKGHACESLACTLDLETARRRLLELGPEVVFNLVESLGSSDRLAHLFPSLLEALGIPYTGNSAAALWLSNNKPLAKERLRQAGLPTPAWQGSQRTRLDRRA